MFWCWNHLSTSGILLPLNGLRYPLIWTCQISDEEWICHQLQKSSRCWECGPCYSCSWLHCMWLSLLNDGWVTGLFLWAQIPMGEVTSNPVWHRPNWQQYCRIEVMVLERSTRSGNDKLKQGPNWKEPEKSCLEFFKLSEGVSRVSVCTLQRSTSPWEHEP